MTTLPTRLNVAFIGKMGSGKTTAADYLAKHYGHTRISFAATLKRLAVELWGKDALTDRDKLQRLGAALRDIDENVWVDATFKYIKDKKLEPPFVVDDCRFPNEYWRIKQEGFITIRIHAPDDVRVDRLQRNGKLQDIEQLKHISEVALDDYGADHSIDNGINDELALYAQIEAVVRYEADRW